MTTVVLNINDSDTLTRAAQVLQAGGLIAFPTDTVYGVAAHAFQPEAVAKLYAAKVRAIGKAIPLLLGDAGDVNDVGRDLMPAAFDLMRAFWPGALTLVVNRSERVPDIVTSGGDSVAVRLPDHVVPRTLARLIAAPLAATSANLSGLPESITAAEVLTHLDGRIDLLLDGGVCPGGVASTVIDVTVEPPVVLRLGALSAEVLERVVGKVHVAGN